MEGREELLDAMWSICHHLPPKVLLDVINGSPNTALELGGSVLIQEVKECMNYSQLVHASSIPNEVTPSMRSDIILSLLDTVLAHIKSSFMREGGTDNHERGEREMNDGPPPKLNKHGSPLGKRKQAGKGPHYISSAYHCWSFYYSVFTI